MIILGCTRLRSRRTVVPSAAVKKQLAVEGFHRIRSAVVVVRDATFRKLIQPLDGEEQLRFIGLRRGKRKKIVRCGDLFVHYQFMLSRNGAIVPRRRVQLRRLPAQRRQCLAREAAVAIFVDHEEGVYGSRSRHRKRNLRFDSEHVRALRHLQQYRAL
jgi:hypothetical protein